MNISLLVPSPQASETFRRNRCRFVPESSGCYVLTTFTNVVLYIGQAVNIQRRMNDHLDNPKKTRQTPLGRAVFFYWIETQDLGKVERTWMNIHIENEGTLPELNKAYSPVSF